MQIRLNSYVTPLKRPLTDKQLHISSATLTIGDDGSVNRFDWFCVRTFFRGKRSEKIKELETLIVYCMIRKLRLATIISLIVTNYPA